MTNSMNPYSVFSPLNKSFDSIEQHLFRIHFKILLNSNKFFKKK
jgi:hypothetical protein